MSSCASQELWKDSGQYCWQHCIFRFREAEHIHPWEPMQLATSQSQIEILLHDTALDSRDLFKNVANGKYVKSTSLLPRNDSCKLISGSSTSLFGALWPFCVRGSHRAHMFLSDLKINGLQRWNKRRFSLRKAELGLSQIIHVASTL